jgi:hypothetical protein
MKSPRQTLIDIIMEGDEDNELQLEFLQGLTLEELADLADNVQEPEDEL